MQRTRKMFNKTLLTSFLGPVILGPVILPSLAVAQHAIDKRVDHGFVDSDGVRLHYASLGERGPLVVLMHGFPDYWYTWRDQMQVLAKDHHVVAFDLRGYNKSDKPKGVANYKMPLLLGDLAAVIRHFGHEKAIVVGHDWGGAIAWNFAMRRPKMVEKLIICNLPHPRGMVRELQNNKQQAKNSQYARNFQKEGAHKLLKPASLVGWVRDPDVRRTYVAAFERSDLEAMLHYYKANFPRPTAATTRGGRPKPPSMPKVKPPVLMIHGLQDKALLASGLNDTWEWLEKDLTLVTVPKAGHFLQPAASEFFSRTMRMFSGLSSADL